jgi:L-ascorbate metabolism protein UlaG (beta-lactamase superfamily)
VRSQQPSLSSSRARRWIAHLWREWTVESWRPMAPAFAHPRPNEWSNANLTAAWLGHSTVLINFFGITVLTDPVLFPRIGIRIRPFFTIGPKRLTKPALELKDLPRIDLVLLSHAHFDHIDTRTLHKFSKHTALVTAPNTSDLLRWMRFRDIIELRWGESHELNTDRRSLRIKAFRVNHWGARLRNDNYRGYNGYILERNNRRIIFGGDTAMTDSFAALRDDCPYDLAIMSIGAYNPWIRSHADPEQVIAMCTAAGVDHIMPVHHQTFRLSFEPLREPIERFEAALRDEPERIALCEIGETFILQPPQTGTVHPARPVS